MRSIRTFTAVTFVLAVAAGCSLVNSFDEVTPPREAVYTSAPKIDVPFVEGGAEASAPAVDAGPAEDHALLVVGGVVEVPDAGERRDPVLAVLDAKNGHELGTREHFHVAGLAHDAARDIWYVFEAPTSFITSPADVVHLHIRKLDAKTGAWTELSDTVVPTLFFYDAIAVTNQRLTFMAHPPEAGAPHMITLDTSNPAAPILLDDRTIPALPVGMIATPGSAGPGGQVALVNTGTAAAGECEAGICRAKVRRFLIPNSGQPQELGTFSFGEMTQFGSVSYGSVVCGGGPDEMFILPKGGPGPHAIHLFDYLSTDGKQPSTFAMNPNSTLLRRAAVDNERRIAFVVEANADTNLHAIPLDGLDGAGDGGSVKAALRHSGQAVFYDTASQTAFAPFNQGDGHTFSAFKVTVTAGAIQLKERSAPPEGDWEPPSDLRPILLGIRNPPTFDCP